MPQILVWKCPHTGKLFESKTKYKTHLKKLSVERVARRKAEAFRKERTNFFANMRATVRTPDELIQFVKTNWDKFCENAELKMWKSDKKLARPTLDSLTLELKWSDTVSNSHSCPFNGVTNWGAMKKDAPTSYPGWIGKIRYKTSEYQPIHGSDMWEGTGVHTGTGGCADSFYYQVELFADDWPAMVEMREKVLVWKKLKGDNRHHNDVIKDIIGNEYA